MGFGGPPGQPPFGEFPPSNSLVAMYPSKTRSRTSTFPSTAWNDGSSRCASLPSPWNGPPARHGSSKRLPTRFVAPESNHPSTSELTSQHPLGMPPFPPSNPAANGPPGGPPGANRPPFPPPAGQGPPPGSFGGPPGNFPPSQGPPPSADGGPGGMHPDRLRMMTGGR